MDKISLRMQRTMQKYLGENHLIFFCQTKDDYKKFISTAQVLVTFTYGIPKEILAEAKDCIFIQKLGAGVNNIDIDGASRRNIAVANTPGLNATSVAEHAVSLITATYKHIVKAHNEIVQHGKWLKTELRDNSYELSYKKVGLVGLGNIGRIVRRILKGYECDVYYYDLFRLSSEEEEKLGIKYMELEKLLEVVDVVSLHVPLTEDTYHLMNKQRLLKMKKTAVLINTCRGEVIDENALYEVVKSGHLTGAGLDVLESEPITKENRLTELPNVILTPHIGGGTVEAMEAVVKQASENIMSVLESGVMKHVHTIVNAKELVETE